MNTLYLECQMGAAGDMLTAALLQLFDHPQEMINAFNRLGLPGVEYRLENAESHGIRGARVHVYVGGVEEVSCDVHEHGHLACDHDHDHDHHDHDHDHHDHDHAHHDHEHPHDHHEHAHHDHEHAHHDHEHPHDHHEHAHHDHEHPHDHHEHAHHDHEHAHHDHEHPHDHHGHAHHHTSLADIQAIVDKLSIDAAIRADIMAVYTLLAEAESAAHGVTVEQVHFHEVGSMDAIADITAVCYLIHQLHPDTIISSPIHVGSGHVHCAHGILPVPAPATAWLLRGIPCYGGHISGELCTPTGAALIRHFAKSYAPMPVMRIAKIGYGLGQKAFDCLNCVRAFFGHQDAPADKIVELACNIDDMTSENLAFAQERLFDAGALEVFITSVMMKKSRPGFVLTVHVPIALKATMIEIIFKHTTTLGVRESILQRYTLDRQIETIATRYGDVRVKKSTGFGVERQKYEYEDRARIAREQNLSLDDVKAILKGD